MEAEKIQETTSNWATKALDPPPPSPQLSDQNTK